MKRIALVAAAVVLAACSAKEETPVADTMTMAPAAAAPAMTDSMMRDSLMRDSVAKADSMKKDTVPPAK